MGETPSGNTIKEEAEEEEAAAVKPGGGKGRSYFEVAMEVPGMQVSGKVDAVLDLKCFSSFSRRYNRTKPVNQQWREHCATTGRSLYIFKVITCCFVVYKTLRI